MSLSGLQRAIRERRCSATELLCRVRQRIAADDARLLAWAFLDERAAQRARELDELAARGQFAGPLHGIPVGVKDIIDVRGLPTSAGSDLRKNDTATADAGVVRRLRDAGAVIVGKTVTTQFACFDPAPTRNPLADDRTPGGSSSGSAAAVAAGHVPLALASQTGGSITRPASYCGVCGYKPTFGAVSVAGCFPVAPSLDHVGLIAASVEDLLVAGACIVEPIPEEPSAHTWLQLHLATVAPRGWWPGPNAAADPEELLARGLRIAIVDRPLADHCSADALTAFQHTCDVLASAGLEVQPAALPADFADVWTAHPVLMAAEAAAVHRTSFERRPDEYLPNVRSLIEEGLRLSAAEYIAARRRQRALREATVRSAFATADVLVCPATPGSPPGRSTTGSPVCNSPWSLLGLPTVSFPAARFADGLPACIQWVGKPFQDAALLQMTAAVQNTLFAEFIPPTAW